MKSKYKLKIKEISMRLKNGSVLLLSIFCLFALASAVQAVPWTDPTCAAPDCNTDGPIWVNPEDPQDSNAASTKPMIYIQDTREISIPAASAYVRSALDGKPAIQGYSVGAGSTSYGGLFSADAAPGLKVSGGIVISSLTDDPTYNEAGLLYLNSGTYANQFRYYSGGWRTLNPWINSGNELYYSLAAGNARGVAIKNGDLTGPTDAYTLDVYRKTSTDADPAYYAERALYARLASYSSDANYASGFIGGYDDYGNLVGVRGKVETSSTDPHYGGYFEATGPTGYGVQGIASNSGSTMNVGGTFSALGTNGVGVSGGAPAYGGYFQATGATGIGVAANGPSTPTETAYAIRTNDGAIAMGEIATIPDEQTNYGMIYVKQDGLDNKIYFKSEGNVEYDLTAGAGASGNIADGTVTGQMTYWNNTAAEWQPVASTDMLWDNTNKNLGIGVSPTTTNKLHVVTSASSGDPVGIYASATRTGAGGNVYGVYSTATGNGSVFGGRFSATGGAINTGVSGSGSTYGGSFSASESDGMGVYAFASNAVNGYGGYFESDGESTTGSAGARALGISKGVWGSATGADGTTAYGGYFTSSCSGNDCVGVYGQTASSVDAGVEGVATANGAADNGYGGYFTTASGVGSGVRGIASYSTAGTTNYGGYFSAAGSTGRGVYGIATATTGLNYGGYFQSSGDTGRGVYGNAAAATGVNYGGYFTASGAGNTGAGLYAKSFATGDNSYGIYGETLSTAAAIYGNNARTTAGTGGVGVEGVSSAPAGGAGVIGRATNTGAGQVRGGEFYSAGSSGDALYASATGASGRGLYVSGLGESARFDGAEVVITDGSDAIGYATGAGDLYVGDALEVDGLGYFGSNIYLGSSGAGATDNYLYFDFGGESLMWDNTNGRFSFSDDLYTTLSIESATTLRAGGIIYGDGNLYLDNDFNSATDVIFFSTTTATDESLMWDSGTDSRFEFTDDLYVGGTFFAGSTADATQFRDASDTAYYLDPSVTTTSLMIAGGIDAVAVYSDIVGATVRDLYIDNTGIVGYVSSSLRYKDNVQDMEDISWLYNLRPVNYTYKNDDGKAKQYGLIAEEVEKVNPFFVSYDEEGLPETVSYSALVTPMLEAIQNQKQQLDALETKVEILEKSGDAELMEYIKKLEARVEALEAEKAEPVKTSFWSKLW